MTTAKCHYCDVRRQGDRQLISVDPFTWAHVCLDCRPSHPSPSLPPSVLHYDIGESSASFEIIAFSDARSDQEFKQFCDEMHARYSNPICIAPEHLGLASESESRMYSVSAGVVDDDGGIWLDAQTKLVGEAAEKYKKFRNAMLPLEYQS